LIVAARSAGVDVSDQFLDQIHLTLPQTR
jgi:hypothetical protein